MALVLLATVGCQDEPSPALESKDSVEAAIRDYLSQRQDLALDNMTVEVTEVEFQGETAEAEVIFRTKSGQGQMLFHYTLRRVGNHWVVEGGSRPRPPAARELPPGHPPVDSPPAQPENLPRPGQS